MSERQSIEWLGMIFFVPANWEIVRHCVNVKSGSVSLIDRRRQRFQFSWTECEKSPDEDLIFSDFKSRDLLENPGCTFSDIESIGRFKAYCRVLSGNVLFRGGLYDKKLKRWLDVAIPCANEEDKTEARQILESYATARKDDKYIRLRAFGLDIASPFEWKLAGADVKPALAAVKYELKNAGAEISRIGAADTWFDGRLEGFLSGRISNAHGNFMVKTRGVHESCVFTGKERRFSFNWIIGRRKVRKDTAWHCTKSNAVYHITTIAGRKTDVSPESFLVNCCFDSKKAI